MRKRVALLLASVLCLCTVLAGCGGSASSGGGKAKILFTVSSMDAFRQTLADAAQSAAQENGVQLDVMDAEGSIEAQVAHIKEAVSGGYNVILCAPVSVDTTVELKATAGDIPIVFVNSCPADKYLAADQYMYVGSDENTAGQFQAEYVLDKLADKDELNVMILKGERGHSGTVGRTKGVKAALEASGKTIHYVFEDYANWDAQQASDMFEVFLKTGQPLDCVLCNNDTMALGVVEACKKNGVDLSGLPVLGVDATADGCLAIQNGEMAFTVYQSATGQGEAAVQAAIALAGGGSAKKVDGISEDGKYVWVPFEKVDSGNVSQYQ